MTEHGTARPKTREYLLQKIRPYKLVVKMTAPLTGYRSQPFIPISYPVAIRGNNLYDIITREKLSPIAENKFKHAYVRNFVQPF
jgi:hypothetical protein